MPGVNRFWLSLHQLSRDYLDEGLTPDERMAAVLEDFQRMSPVAQRELLADMVPLAAHLPNLYAAARDSYRPGEVRPRGQTA